ncbi:hypothetical protein FRC02_000341 [Tulasnella sp. 418]|nr:hypothetical protein FRC02_000341 [Tulasnella sp. 418]
MGEQESGNDFVQVVDQMTASISSVQESIRSLIDKQKSDPLHLDIKDGISLLSTKNNVLASYIHSLVLLSSQRLLGHSLLDRSPPNDSFASTSRKSRGADAGDLVDALVEGRAVLERIKTLESRMKYQIDKLVRVAKESPTASGSKDLVTDPLAFKPNPQNLMVRADENDAEVSGSDGETSKADGVYRPPRVAPMPYTETSRKDKNSRRPPPPSALASLAYLDPSNPHVENTSGLGGGMPTLSTTRARELENMTRYEEEFMTRLVMKKKDNNRRLRDEEDIALGGGGTGRGRIGGFDSEFNDVLRGIDRNKRTRIGDGYEELRMKARKASALERSKRRIGVDEGVNEMGQERGKKRNKFEKQIKAAKRRAKK